MQIKSRDANAADLNIHYYLQKFGSLDVQISYFVIKWVKYKGLMGEAKYCRSRNIH